MQEAEVYQPVWKKYLPVIAMKLKQAMRKNEPVSFNLYKPDFQNVTKRKKTIFDFTLEIRDGQAKNLSTISEVAKDLYKVLKQDAAMSKVINNGHFVFTLDGDFSLKLQQGIQVTEIVETLTDKE